nr:hypothetical protein [Burkholderia pyrrocinia]
MFNRGFLRYRIADEIHIAVARPRDRRDPSLAAQRARLLDAFQRFHDRADGTAHPPHDHRTSRSEIRGA